MNAAFGASDAPSSATPSETWQPKPPPLPTRWTAEVGPAHTLPKYPRPHMTRKRWHNLNGVWEYAGSETPPAESAMRERVLVPYPPESSLSGIQRHDEHMLYRRTFKVPANWRGQRLLLHFGAVDQHAEVRINGRTVAIHEGGFTGFTADITDAVHGGDPQEIVVAAMDRNENDPYPVGKQRNTPQGILYTGTSGIWQTVWLEPVPLAHISKLDVRPDLGSRSFVLTARTGSAEGQRVEAIVAEPGGREVARTSSEPDTELRLPVPDARLWSPQHPFLYGLTVRLLGPGGQVVDEVGSYAGMRSIELVRDERGRPRMALNGEILFQNGLLDQGYWPDGVYTAPTDEALRFDLERTKELGFNTVRKHAKVEPARWYYWADRIGLLVWQDMPSLPISLNHEPGTNPPPGEWARANFEREQSKLIDQLGHFPSIIGWVPFNEGWGEFDTARVADSIATRDPSRLVNANSGANCCYSLPDTGAGDVYDDHTYVGPGAPDVGDRVSIDGEYGGLGLMEPDHLWPGVPQAYEMTDSRDELTRRYGELSRMLRDIVLDKGLSAAIYTQVTDVENEVNGLFTYDREILKPSLEVVREHNRAVIEAGTPTIRPEEATAIRLQTRLSGKQETMDQTQSEMDQRWRMSAIPARSDLAPPRATRTSPLPPHSGEWATGSSVEPHRVPSVAEHIQIPTDAGTFDALATGPEDGRAVLFLHGFPESGLQWNSQLATLGETGCRAVAPDQRGYSPGVRPEQVFEYRMEELVADVVAFADQLGWRRFDLAGHDWGAAVAWATAAAHPRRVRTLTAVSVPHWDAFSHALTHDEDQQQRSAYMRTFRASGAERELLADNARKLRGIYQNRIPRSHVEEYVQRLSEPGALTAALNWYRAMRYSAAIGSVSVPTLYVWSTEDVAIGSAAAFSARKHVTGHYRFEMLEDVSHWIPEEAPKELTRLMLEHLLEYRD